MKNKALITGITGQDGSYLAELLLDKGYDVVGIYRPESPDKNIGKVKNKIILYKGDIQNKDFIKEVILTEKPNEIYNLASIATVAKPWDDPVNIINVTGIVPINILEILRGNLLETKFFQASSAEMFGDPTESPQSEKTIFLPKNPYGMGKLLAYQAIAQYRAQHKIFAVSGILFNHESPRRGEGFITRKITKTLTRIEAGLEKELVVGNLNAVRDWGFAGDYVEAMWMSLQNGIADDYVIASGETHTVRDFVNATAKALNLPIFWEGGDEHEIGKDSQGSVVVRISKDFYRPVEKVDRCGDISKIKKALGWEPDTSFEKLVELMVMADRKALTG